MSITPTGVYLPPQIIYKGTTKRCHPTYRFPNGWDIWHSSSHWSMEDTVNIFVENVLVPYIEKEKNKLTCRITTTSQKSLLIYDVFAAHRVEPVLHNLEENNILVIFVPPNCTDSLQPLDVSINKPFKTEIKRHFVKWYSDEVKQQLDNGTPVGEVKICMKMSRNERFLL